MRNLLRLSGNVLDWSRSRVLAKAQTRRQTGPGRFVTSMASTTSFLVEHTVDARQTQQATSSPIASGRYRR